jgi:hypothetical protein
VYVEKLDYIWQRNRDMSLMATNSVSRYLATQKRAFQGFEQHYTQNLQQIPANE